LARTKKKIYEIAPAIRMSSTNSFQMLCESHPTGASHPNGLNKFVSDVV
jgi:hypothetical protein